MFKTRSSVTAEPTGAAQQALQAAGAALDEGRDLAGEAAAKAAETMRNLRDGAAAAAARSADSLNDAATAAQRGLNRYATAANRYARSEPLTTALIAAAVGAAVTALMVALLRDRRDE